MMNVQMPTINKKIAIEYLKFFYPRLRTEIIQLSVKDNFAGIMQSTINYLKTLLKEAKINIIGHHIKVMETIYRSGDSYVREMIENLFIRSFESFKKLIKTNHWNMLYQYIPAAFQQIYINQNRLDEMMFTKKTRMPA